MHKLITPVAAASILTLGLAALAHSAGAARGGPSGAGASTGTYGTTGATGTSNAANAANAANAMGAATKAGSASTTSTVGMTGQSCTMDENLKTTAVLQFLHEANLAEIKEGNLAPTRASSPDVKTYAADLVKEHTDADQKLTDLAKKKGIDLMRGTIADPIHAAVLTASDADGAALGGKTGKAFDTAFVAPEVHEHMLAIKVVDEGLKVAKDAEVKSLLTDVRAALTKHLKHSWKLQDQLAMGAPTGGAASGIGGGPKPDDVAPNKGTTPMSPTKGSDAK